MKTARQVLEYRRDLYDCVANKLISTEPVEAGAKLARNLELAAVKSLKADVWAINIALQILEEQDGYAGEGEECRTPQDIIKSVDVASQYPANARPFPLHQGATQKDQLEWLLIYCTIINKTTGNCLAGRADAPHKNVMMSAMAENISTFWKVIYEWIWTECDVILAVNGRTLAVDRAGIEHFMSGQIYDL